MKWDWLAGLCLGLTCLISNSVSAEQQEPSALAMVDDLIRSPDRDMRGLGLQQVREGLPGEAATRHFAELVANLPAEGQAALVEALGDRGDRMARSAILKALASPHEPVRLATIRALGLLGDAGDVPALAEKAALGSTAEKQAARQSLVRLKGERINATIVDAMAKASPGVQVELLRALAARNAKESVGTVLRCVSSPDRSVRLAALAAARTLAGEKELAEVIRILSTVKDDSERRAAAAVLLAICGRSGKACAEPIVRAIETADVPTRVSLLQALGKAGGPKALDAVVKRLHDADSTVRGEALRVLSAWPDRAAAPHLRKIAKDSADLNEKVLALRGLVQLAQPRGDRPADVALLGEAMKLADRPEEKRLALSALGGIPTPASLALVAASIDDPALAEEASLAVVLIAEKLPAGNRSEVRAAMKKVLDRCKEPTVRQRAERLSNGI